MSNTEEKTNEMDETLEKVIVEEEGNSYCSTSDMFAG